MTAPAPTPQEFWERVTTGAESECWTWTGARDQQGYGHLKVEPLSGQSASPQSCGGPVSGARERLAALLLALWEEDAGDSLDGIDGVSEAIDAYLTRLLPVVQSLMAEHAAAELEIVRQWLMETGRTDADTLQQIRERIGQHREATT